MLIDSKTILELKNAIKNECLRRHYVGSVETYGGSDYDFSKPANVGDLILTEHFSKNSIPLNAISNKFPISESGLITDTAILQMKAQVANLSNIALTSEVTGCDASCTGLCSTSCTSCSGSCSGGCSGCSGGCDGSCEGCDNTCVGGCNTICSTECTLNGCTEECGTCTSQCEQYGSAFCQCSGACRNTCTTYADSQV